MQRETLQSVIDLAPKALIGMEACLGSQWLARKLVEKGRNALEARSQHSKAVGALANKLTRIVRAILTHPGTVHLRSNGAAA